MLYVAHLYDLPFGFGTAWLCALCFTACFWNIIFNHECDLLFLLGCFSDSDL